MPPQPAPACAAGPESILPAFPEDFDVFRAALEGKVASARAPVPADPVARAGAERRIQRSYYAPMTTGMGLIALEDLS